MITRLWPALTVLLGLATLGAFLNFTGVQDVWAAGAIGAKVSAFQQSMADTLLSTLLANAGEAQAMHAINDWDTLVFIPAYTLFLLAAALWLGGLRNPTTWLAIVAALVGAGADWMETALQLDVTRPFLELPADAQLAGTVGADIGTWHWTKYVALGLNAWAIAGLCLMGARKRWIIGVLGLIPLIAVAAAWFDAFPFAFPFNLTFVPFWLALIVTAAIALLPARVASA